MMECAKAAELVKENWEALRLLAILLERSGHPSNAYNAAVAGGGSAAAFGRFKEAAELFGKASANARKAGLDDVPAEIRRASALMTIGAADKARRHLEAAIAGLPASPGPEHPELHALLSVALMRTGRAPEAAEAAARGAALGSKKALVYQCQALLAAAGTAAPSDATMAVCEAAVDREGSEEAWGIYAVAARSAGREEQALARMRGRAAGDSPGSQFVLARLLREAGKLAEAADVAEAVMAKAPEGQGVRLRLATDACISLSEMAARDRDAVSERLMRAGKAALAVTGAAGGPPSAAAWDCLISEVTRSFGYHEVPAVFGGGVPWPELAARMRRDVVASTSLITPDHFQPWRTLALPFTPSETLLVAKAVSADLPRVASLRPLPDRAPGRLLRVGVVSAQLGTDALAYLVSPLFDEGALPGCEPLFVYFLENLSAVRSSAHVIRGRAGERARDIPRTMSAAEAAALVIADDLDVLIDLNGYTTAPRMDVFCAGRLARQHVLLGTAYPATAGNAACIGWYVADPFIAPPHLAKRAFAEHLVLLPGFYSPNDYRKGELQQQQQQQQQQQDALKDRRAAWHLPAEGPLACSWNQLYKVDPQLFDLWVTDIILKTEGATLWMIADSLLGRQRLTRRAEELGLEPSRLVFADRAATEQHLSRLTLCDLALDTLHVSGHTTATDALWMEVPTVSLPGSSLASRVSSSALANSGLHAYIAPSLKAYLSLSQDILAHPAKHKAVFQGAARSSPIFDPKTWLRSFSSALQALTESRSAPRPMHVVM